MAAEEPQAQGDSRIAYIDGLRGIAVLWVVLYHAWVIQQNWLTAGSTVRFSVSAYVSDVLSNGPQGVSLFLVLSGFCLSYPSFVRRSSGRRDWFRASHFFARRCLRILPPYYAALTLCLVAAVLAPAWAAQRSGIGAFPTTPNLIEHLLLVHNWTQNAFAIDAPFWSLGLEWQWYFVFPVVLLLVMARPWWSLAACLAVAAIAHEHHFLSYTYPQLRLFEFACGVVAAKLIAGRRVPHASALVVIILAALALAQSAGAQALDTRIVGTGETPWGIAFAAIVLLGATYTPVRRALSWRPLVWVGIISYSLYLIHYPVVLISVRSAPSGTSVWVLIALATVLAIAAAWAFHLAVERPCMSPSTWQRVGPRLIRLFLWADFAWDRLAGLGGRTGSQDDEQEVLAPAGTA